MGPGGVTTTEYTECQVFCLVHRIGSPHSHIRKRMLLPPFGSKGGDTLAGEGVGAPNSIEGVDRRKIRLIEGNAKCRHLKK
jgi:hypothetical protein